MIGEPLDHRQFNTTARYAYRAGESVRVSTARVADSIGEDILTEQDRGAQRRAFMTTTHGNLRWRH